MAHLEGVVVERLIEQAATVCCRAEMALTEPDQHRAADVGRTALESAVQGRDARFRFQRQQRIERCFPDFFVAVVQPFIEPARRQRRALPQLGELLDRV